MTKIFLLALFVLLAFWLFSRFRGKLKLPTQSLKSEFLPYSKKPYLMSRTENEFFKTLERAVGANYYVFPQVNLDKIIYANGQHSYRNPYYNKIDRKSVDYVLFDKTNISPVLAIELDDYTHQRADRQARDGFVDRVFDRCGIPILHIQSVLREEDLRAQIATKIKV